MSFPAMQPSVQQRRALRRALNLQAAQQLKPPPRLTVSEWADRERRLSAEASAEPGRWVTARNEPMRGVMDAVSEPDVEQVVVMSSSQVGKSEVLNNVIGFHIDQDPAPILLVQPTIVTAENYSKKRIAPMLRDTPALAEKVPPGKSRDSGNTLLQKMFPGGDLTLAGANSPASLAGMPIRVVLLDEVDRYPLSAGAEGDPVSLARKRTVTFWNRKIILTSTPTIKGFSRIEAAWDESDQRRFFVACPDCGEEQHLVWAQVHWPDGKPHEALYCCAAEDCGSLWDDASRWRAIRKGHWKATAPFRGIAGFHLNQLYSPWARLGEIAAEFLQAKRSPETLKTFINTVLGEAWEDQGQRVSGGELVERLEDWGDKAPAAVLCVTCGVDVQDNRLEVERVGWGLHDESWSLDHQVWYGDPSAPALWQQLDDYLRQATTTADGRQLPVKATAVDTGGHHTQAVYRFCRARFSRRIYAIKGVAGQGRPVWPKRASRAKQGGALLFAVGVDAAKDSIMARLRIAEPGPGYCHFPVGREPDYFEQFGAETKVTKKVRGFPVISWVKREGARNEAIDLRVYAFAALQALNVNWSRVQARLDTRFAAPPKVRPAPAPMPSLAPPTDDDPLPAPRPAAPPKVPARRLGRRRSVSSFMSS